MKVISKCIHICSIGLLFTILAFLSCNKESIPPAAVLKAFPSYGDTSVLFDFDASASEDDQNYAVALQFRWDFDGDGEWDTDYSNNNAITHKFKQSGNYKVTVSVKDNDGFSSIATDTVEVFRMNTDIDTLLDSRDGNKYRIVKIGDQWWMAENLRYGIVIPIDREQTDNNVVERYRDLQSIDKDTVGGVYLWLESMNYHLNDPKGICPDGWHLPTQLEWDALFDPYPVYYTFNGVHSNLYSLQYYRKDGCSNLNLDLNNQAIRLEDGSFVWDYWLGGFWSSDSSWDTEYSHYFPYTCYFNSPNIMLVYGYSTWNRHMVAPPRKSYMSIRCVKDK